MLIYVTGDLHIGQSMKYGKTSPNGLSEKLVEQGAMLDKFVDDAIAAGAEVVFLQGDYFPKHFRIDPTAIRFFTYPILKLARAGIKVKMLLGNHDKARHENMDSNVDYFNIFDINNVEVIGEPKAELIQDARGNHVVAMYLPHLIPAELYKWQKHEKEGVVEIIANILDYLVKEAETIIANANLPAKTPRILSGHFGISEAGRGSESSMVANNNICFPAAILDRPGINLAIFSHIHKFWVCKNTQNTQIVSIGSMDRFDFGELEDKKYGKIQIEGEEIHLKAVYTSPHPFVSIKHDINNDSPLDFLNHYDVNNAVVKVSLRADRDFTDHKNINAQIREWLEKHNVYYIDGISIVPKPHFTSHHQDITEEVDIDANIHQLLAEDYPDIDKKLFAKHLALKDQVEAEGD